MLRNRSQYATFITILLAGMVLSTASILILHQESRSPGANITTGGDALWWGIVTITTVGYGDFYPVTTLGRITAVFVMFAGIGIIGALASILASVLVAPTDAEGTAPDRPRRSIAAQAPGAVSASSGPVAVSTTGSIADELAGLRAEMALQRAEIAALRSALGSGSS